jgi:hypothetical protein
MATGEPSKPQFPPFLANDQSTFDAKASGMSASCCIKCHTGLHIGGPEECPWKNQTDKNAHKAGAKALKNLATGTSTQPHGKGKDVD